MRRLLVCCFVVCFGCTTDDPGPKKCEPGSSDPALQCVSGYTCDCKPEGCYCVKQSGLHVSPPAVRPETDPYRELLRRIGAFDPPGRRE